MGIKITLAQARAQQRYSWLVVKCASTPAGAAGCHHAGEMSLLHAIVLWGEDRRLDELPLKCSRCGSRKVDVRVERAGWVGIRLSERLIASVFTG